MIPRTFRFFVLALFLLMGSISCFGQQEDLKDISVQKALSNIDNPHILWFDIRESKEFSTLPKLPFAQHVPLSTFPSSFANLEIKKDQTFYIICRSGNRSKRLQSHLVSQGYTNAINVLGGMKAWKKMEQKVAD